MVARRQLRRTTDRGSGGDYKVGYGKPPQDTQFKLGRSGKPAGRPKGGHNLKTDVRRTLQKPIKVTEEGRTRKRSTQEGALMVLREKALKGDVRSLNCLLELAQRFNNDATETGSAQSLTSDDQAILDAYIADVSASKEMETAAVSPRKSKRKSRRQTRPTKKE